jgi:two-component system KDP operon response regulator KdpE
VARVLVVDDEPQIRRAVELNLLARGYDVAGAGSGEEALRSVEERPPDLVVLDLGLPGIDGLEVIRRLRRAHRLPIVVLSVRQDEVDKVAALDLGADDYVNKPFGMGELLARVRAALRRTGRRDGVPVVRTEAFTLDLDAGRAVDAAGEVVRLTPIEWRLVEHLARRAGQLVTQAALLEAVWGPQYTDATGYLRVHLAHVRQKLEPEPSRPRYFVTEPGIGYRFLPDTRSISEPDAPCEGTDR